MRDYIDKIIEVERKIEARLGRFNLFALLERDDVKDKWDVLISMSISLTQKNEVIKIIHGEFVKELPKEAIFKISRFVYLEPSNPIVQNFNMMVSVQHSNVEIKDSMINNLMIKNAFVISSQRGK
tara:strand:+ start:10440 stop:10814 length:375 start_codon:yes stop_codon:yes gene_type:complete